MSKFQERIKELRTEKGLRQQDLADRIGVSRATVADWETGRHEPPIDTLIKVCQFFEVSSDYLIGLSD